MMEFRRLFFYFLLSFTCWAQASASVDGFCENQLRFDFMTAPDSMVVMKPTTSFLNFKSVKNDFRWQSKAAGFHEHFGLILLKDFAESRPWSVFRFIEIRQVETERFQLTLLEGNVERVKIASDGKTAEVVLSRGNESYKVIVQSLDTYFVH